MRNEEGLKHNPVGVKVVLRTQGNRSTFHLFERIPIELEFTSIEPSAYSIELDETMNFAGSANRFEVSNPETVFLNVSQVVGFAAICCEWNKRYLARQPVILKGELTDDLRIEKPGAYSNSFVTNRVFRKLGKQDDPGKSDLTPTSNILTLNILPDDDQWDSQQLSAILRLLSDPPVKANYLAAVKRAKQLPTETASDFAMTNNCLANRVRHRSTIPQRSGFRRGHPPARENDTNGIQRSFGHGTRLPDRIRTSAAIPGVQHPGRLLCTKNEGTS
jgi:hypothetical protein